MNANHHMVHINDIFNQSQAPISCMPFQAATPVPLTNVMHPFFCNDNRPQYPVNATPSISISNASPMGYMPQIYQFPVPVSYQTYIVKPSSAIPHVAQFPTVPSIPSLLTNNTPLSINQMDAGVQHGHAVYAHTQTQALATMPRFELEPPRVAHSNRSSLFHVQSPANYQRHGNQSQALNHNQNPMVLPPPSIPMPLALPPPVAVNQSDLDLVDIQNTNGATVHALDDDNTMRSPQSTDTFVSAHPEPAGSSRSNSNQSPLAMSTSQNDEESRNGAAETSAENQAKRGVGHTESYRMSGDGQKFVCSTCNKVFQHRSSVIRHIKTAHRMAKPYHCTVPECGQSFARLHLLTLHSRVHSGIKPYRCPDADCNKAFKQKAHLTEHIRVHTGEKPYRCEFCDRRFRQKSVLDTHRRRHTGERPFQCAHCKRSFGHYTSYWRHTNNRICLKKKNKKQTVPKDARKC